MCLLPLLSHEQLCGRRECGGESLGTWSAALRQIFAAATASANFVQGFLQQSSHIVRLACGLGEHQRGLWRSGSKQGNRSGLARQFLCQQLEKVKITV